MKIIQIVYGKNIEGLDCIYGLGDNGHLYIHVIEIGGGWHKIC
jgi:hypothetical protein